MKKIFSTLVLVSLCIPSLSFSQTGAMPIQPMLLREDRPAPMRASTTREQLREPRIASSTKQLGFCTQIEKALITINNKGMMGAEKRTEAMNNQADKREELFSFINETGHELNDNIGWAVRVMSARDISAAMLYPTNVVNLNQQAHNATIKLIQDVIESGVNVTEVYVDTVGLLILIKESFRKHFRVLRLL